MRTQGLGQDNPDGEAHLIVIKQGYIALDALADSYSIRGLMLEMSAGRKNSKRCLDLRKETDPTSLKELAAFNLIAVMCFPNDLIGRERILGAIQKETGVSKPRRRPFDVDEFRTEWALHCARGVQIGHLLLTMIQLRSLGHEPSLRLAIHLQTETHLPRWTKSMAESWNSESHIGHFARSRRVILRYANYYAPVAHLWAAHLHSVQAVESPLPGDRPSWPDTAGGLLRLLGYAEIFLELETKAKPPRGSDQKFFASCDPWRIIVPDHLIIQPKIQALPIPDEWAAIITGYRKLSH